MEIEQRQLVHQGIGILNDRGIFDEHGHLSSRSRSDSDRIAINRRSSPAAANLVDIVAFTLGDADRAAGVPGETPIHEQVYEARPDVNSVCHNHSWYATTVASLGIEMRPVHPNGALQADPIPVYETERADDGVLITTDDDAASMAQALGDSRAVLLPSHGVVVVGRSVAEAVVSCIKLELNAAMLYEQALVGEPNYLPEDRVEREVDRVRSERSILKSLDYYLSE